MLLPKLIHWIPAGVYTRETGAGMTQKRTTIDFLIIISIFHITTPLHRNHTRSLRIIRRANLPE